MPKLVRSLNQPVIISSPAYFGDDEPRRLILVDIEVQGLWFSGEALHAPLEDRELTERPAHAVATVFFPFAQISYLFDPRQFAKLPEGVMVTDRIVEHPALARAPLAYPAMRQEAVPKRPAAGKAATSHPKTRR